jgi:membrane-bound ClpP family serine protease
MSNDITPLIVLGFILFVLAFAVFLFYQSVVAGVLILIVAIILVLAGGRRQTREGSSDSLI